ncbi:hypothetical protein SAFG77S_08469 [Streptomyces afghaniensis]|uniref:hypothetical protein n=1 Tax=Streptomyces afghaniensis TaxID=66865 RepID=UPI000FE1E862|nr:hypothetical protein [Streptomyces afghaniensis]
MPNGADQAGTTDGYAAALESLRSTAKWLLAAFAGAGAVLAAGLQLSRIGELKADDWRLWGALLGAGMALGAVGYMATQAATVLSQEWVTLSSFSDEEGHSLLQAVPTDERNRRFRKVGELIDDNRHELYGHAALDLPDLHRKLREVDDRVHSPEGAVEQREALAEAAALRAVAREVAQCANYFWTLELFQQMKKRLAGASLIAMLGLALFAYAANPPAAEKPLDVRIYKCGTGVHTGSENLKYCR